MDGTALDRITVFSADRIYRYTLWREFDLTNHRYVQFIGLNPSTADEVQDDPTIRRCIDFAKRWGYGAMCMTNIFAFRATDPAVMKVQAEPVGPANDHWLQEIAGDASLVVAAWGIHGEHLQRGAKVTAMLKGADRPVVCLGRTVSGMPKHPLWIPARTAPAPFG